MDKKLTVKQRRFVEAYSKSGNATKSAIAAGYSEKTAGSIGSENLTKPYISEAIERRQMNVFEQPASTNNGRRTPSTSLYLIRAANGFVKIGISANVRKRFDALNASSPIELELIFTKTDMFACDLEAQLHKQYAAKRVKGEWFNLSDGDIRDIIRAHGQANR